MANIKSAKKRVEVIKKKTLRNTSVKSSLRTTIKRFEEAINKKNLEYATGNLKQVLRTLDKAVAKGILHKNAAARKKARLNIAFNKLNEEKAS